LKTIQFFIHDFAGILKMSQQFTLRKWLGFFMSTPEHTEMKFMGE